MDVRRPGQSWADPGPPARSLRGRAGAVSSAGAAELGCERAGINLRSERKTPQVGAAGAVAMGAVGPRRADGAQLLPSRVGLNKHIPAGRFESSVIAVDNIMGAGRLMHKGWRAQDHTGAPKGRCKPRELVAELVTESPAFPGRQPRVPCGRMTKPDVRSVMRVARNWVTAGVGVVHVVIEDPRNLQAGRGPERDRLGSAQHRPRVGQGQAHGTVECLIGGQEAGHA